MSMEQPTEPGFYWAHGGNHDWVPVELRRVGDDHSVCIHGSDYYVGLVDGKPEFGPWDGWIEWGPRIEPPGSWNPNRYASTTYTLVRCPKCGETADKTVTRSRSDAPR